MSSITHDQEAYWSVCTIRIKPGKAKEAYDSLNEVAKDTLTKEPGAHIYRFWKTEGKDEFVCVEKFASREAYKIHTSSEHVKRWADKYYRDSELFDGEFEFHPLTTEGLPAGGFDRA